MPHKLFQSTKYEMNLQNSLCKASKTLQSINLYITIYKITLQSTKYITIYKIYKYKHKKLQINITSVSL